MTYLERIAAIESACQKHKIPHNIHPCHDGWKIDFPWCFGDIACNSMTIGHNDDLNLVESYLFPWDEGNVTVLTIKEATLKLIALYILYQLQKITLDN